MQLWSHLNCRATFQFQLMSHNKLLDRFKISHQDSTAKSSNKITIYYKLLTTKYDQSFPNPSRLIWIIVQGNSIKQDLLNLSHHQTFPISFSHQFMTEWLNLCYSTNSTVERRAWDIYETIPIWTSFEQSEGIWKKKLASEESPPTKKV